MTLEDLNLGIIGVGGMGSSHARMAADGEIPGVRLAAVCDPSPEAMAQFSEAQAFDSVTDLIESGAVDAIVVATPHYSHPEIAIAGIRAGLHILVEKPLAVTTLDAQRIIDTYQQRENTDQLFAVMFNQRTNPRFIRLREMIRSGDLGRIRRVSWIITDWFRTEAYYRSGGWRATWAGEGGGVLVNQCPHQLDLMQWLFGMPTKVRAFAQFGADHDIEVEDRVTAYLEYDDGATGTFIASTGEFPGSNRLEVACDRGKLVIDESEESDGAFRFIKTTPAVPEYSQQTSERFKGPEFETITIPTDGKGGQHLEILSNFAAAIRGEAELIGPGVEGIHGVELANAMLYSAWTEETVDLPIPPDAFAQSLSKRTASSRFVKKPTLTASDDISGSF